MQSFFKSLVLLAVASTTLVSASPSPPTPRGLGGDPCAKIGGKTWVSPSDVRACYESYPVDEDAKSNILEVIEKTLAFHTSVNYQIQAPAPFDNDVKEDLIADIERIRGQSYDSDYDFHIDISRAVRRLNDGHCVWINSCYDSLFVNYLPIPLVVLTDKHGKQNIHIAPEAYQVASAEFGDQIGEWEKSISSGKLEDFSGAKVILLNNADPWKAVNANTEIAGSYQAFGTRQNGFFSSYHRVAEEWSYSMGQFAQQSLPFDDKVDLLVQREGSWIPEYISLPYFSRKGAGTADFTDTASWRENNCKAVQGTNGVDAYAPTEGDESRKAVAKFRQAPTPTGPVTKHMVNAMLDVKEPKDITLPEELQPLQAPVDGSVGDAQFYMLEDGITGVFALGSFSGAGFDELLSGTLTGLQNLKAAGAQQLIVDVTNNGGGYICVAHWLHRIIIGPKDTTEPQAGLDTKARAGELALAITDKITTEGLDPYNLLLYNPINWRDANDQTFPNTTNWLEPTVDITINGHEDSFSPRLGDECQPFTHDAPAEGLFEPSKILIASNGRCASSCSLFSITMSKEEGVKTVVMGGKKDVDQQYCGIVGGQSTDFSTMDTEVKTSGLKDHPLAPPDLIVNGVQGITWRLGFGVDDPEEPEEWQSHPADINFELTAETVNKPEAIWKELAKLF